MGLIRIPSISLSEVGSGSRAQNIGVMRDLLRIYRDFQNGPFGFNLVMMV